MKTRVSLLFLALLSCVPSLASAQGGCTRIDSSKPAQLLSVELLEEKRNEVLLRFRNNTNCYVTLLALQDPEDLRALVLNRRPDGSPLIRIVGPENLPDGRRIDLDYDIEYLQPLPPAKKVIFVDSVVYRLRVGPGSSFIFGVPLSGFDYLNIIRVPFRYDWDSEFYAPSHNAVFHSVNLPIEILRKTKACSQIEGCAPEQ